MRIKISDIEESNFYKMPKSIYELDLKPVEREVYMVCMENWRMSLSNNWVNENEEIYFYASQEKLANLLRVDKTTIIRCFKRLVDVGILEKEKENGNANKYFLIKIEEVVKINQLQNATGGKMQLDQWQNATGTSGKMQPNKEYNKNNIIRINKYIYKSEKFHQTFSDFLEMRKKIKKPATEKAIELILSKLEKINNEELSIKMLENSILNNWQDVYLPREENNGNKNYKGNNTRKREVITRNYNDGAEIFNQ